MFLCAVFFYLEVCQTERSSRAEPQAGFGRKKKRCMFKRVREYLYEDVCLSVSLCVWMCFRVFRCVGMCLRVHFLCEGVLRCVGVCVCECFGTVRL